MKLGIMQPYFFPYIGYFQLIQAVDRFVVYDDVNFIKSGWINRNRVLVNGQAAYFNIGIRGASSFKLICEIELDANPLWRSKVLKTIQASYGKAPHFAIVYELVQSIMMFRTTSLADFVYNSLVQICNFVEIKTRIVRSSEVELNRELYGTERILDICQRNAADVYINAIGGKELYSKEQFQASNVSLKFLRTKPFVYKQFTGEFTPNLSFIDVLMFNSQSNVKALLNEYELL